MIWKKQNLPGSMLSNWNKIEQFLGRFNAFDAAAIKIVETVSDGEVETIVIYPIYDAPVEPEL